MLSIVLLNSETGAISSFAVQRDGTLNNFGDTDGLFAAPVSTIAAVYPCVIVCDCELCDRSKLTLFWSKMRLRTSLLFGTSKWL
jgi:hypothetical protein